jgi:ABC-type uncharacterized transport system permease subunit
MTSILMGMHIFCALISYGAFLIAFISGLLFLIQEHQLKGKQMGSLFYRLPSLEQLDRLNLWAVAVGFVLFSVAVLCGMVVVYQLFGQWWTGDSKQVLSVGLWGWYLVLWLVRARSTLRGRRVALLSILGFSFVLFTFVGSRVVVQSGHPYVQLSKANAGYGR